MTAPPWLHWFDKAYQLLVEQATSCSVPRIWQLLPEQLRVQFHMLS
jgi:hypothetical protein